jgi:NAD(P)H dehydrogenase (quinone)
MMQNVTISIVYHSPNGHTRQLAEVLAEQMRTDQCTVHLLDTDEGLKSFELLHGSDTIVFGCPTHFGNVSAGFKQFFDATGSFWYRQLWKDKLATAFTISSTVCGDKLNTLQTLMLFACQHGMNWISLGILPRFINDEQTDGQNRLACYIGLMAQCDNSHTQPKPLHPGDQLTAELFAQRIVALTQQYKIRIPGAAVMEDTNNKILHQ